ncbi:MAG: hypothetical protein GXP25_07975 [Planctomycetes bacterium]|nr:hypothetical protein [Planctomycetota bacterium]
MKPFRLTCVVLFCVVVTAPAALAEGELKIEHLSAKPRLQEDLKTYTIEVRFTTNLPAVATCRYGTDDRCTETMKPEPEACRNHRFDIAGIPSDQRRSVQVTAKAEEGPKVSSEVIEVKPPGMFPKGSAKTLHVPLTVTETEGMARNEPVTFGVPLPKGALGWAHMARLMDGEQALPIATRALVRWPDGTIKWLLVTSKVKVGANQTKKLKLIIGAESQPILYRTGSMVIRDGESIIVGMGDTRLVINTTTGLGGLYVNDRIVSALPVSRLTAVDGTIYTGKVETVEVEESNAQRAVIKVSGHHVNEKGEPYFGFTLRYFCHFGDPFVRVDHILQHDIVKPEYKYGDEMKSFAALDLVFGPAESRGPGKVLLEGDRIAELGEGQRLFQHFDDKWLMGDEQGKRCPGLVSKGALSVAVRDFWQQWPKGLHVEGGKLVIGLYPKIEPKDRYANKPNEEILTFYLRDGNYTFRSGFEKRHELCFGPSDAATPKEILARVNSPLLVTANPKWYCKSGALFGIASDDPKEFAMYDKIMSDGIDQYFDLRKARHWYGLMNFGDTEGGRSHSWRNIEYDTPHGLFTQYFRTGDRRFFVAAEQASRHNADVDVVHYAAGQVAGPGPGRRVGQAWVHCMGHTGGYYPYNHLGMTLYATGYCTNRGHMWNQGNLEYYFLTGDRQVHRSAMQLGGWVCGWNTTEFSYGNARVPGWMGIIAMSTYFATYDEFYLNGMRLMYEEVKAKGDPKYGLWIHKLGGGHCRCQEKHHGEAGFMAGVLMTALKYFYLATGDREVAERIVKIANYLVDHMWVPEEGAFHYTTCPNTGVSPILSLIEANGLAFAANYSHDKRLMDVTREAFINGLIAFKKGGPGNGICYGLPICSAPMAMYEISKFPGPKLNEVYDLMERAALNPARRPVPALMPNPDFEEDTRGWTVRGDLKLSRNTDAPHTGRASAMASGEIKGQNEYFVTRYACGPPWEITWLERGKTYRMQLWLRVDRIGEGVPGPRPRVAMRAKGRTQGAFYTNRYDLTGRGAWQLLQTEFTVPDYYDALYIAVSTDSREEQKDVLMYMDDVTIVPVNTPKRETYVYPACYATDAKLTGGLALVDDKMQRGWKAVGSPKGRAGTARFPVEIPLSDTYRIFARAKSPEGEAALEVTVDGKPAGTFRIAKSATYNWLELSGVCLSFEAGRHVVSFSFGAGQSVVLQKICLTNELSPQAGK